ncbi:MAG: hypothetical protein FJ308_00420 [Planctomycetes bacterium]|nr:hypothetical protein [Planctomycetota bacterium]
MRPMPNRNGRGGARNQGGASKSRRTLRILVVGAMATLANATVGCQGNPLSGNLLGGLNQATRVPPPSLGTPKGPTNYSGTVGQPSVGSPASSLPNANQPSAASGFNPANKTTQSSFPNNPLADGIAAAENQVLGVTQNVTNALQQSSNAINKSTNAINSSVQQASARIDRLGQGVAQASEVLTATVQDPLPLPPVVSGSIPAPVVSPSNTAPSSSGSLSDTVIDPNAQWRKPTPR